MTTHAPFPLCRRCGETAEDLVETITDARGTQLYCTVCGFAWWVIGPFKKAV